MTGRYTHLMAEEGFFIYMDNRGKPLHQLSKEVEQYLGRIPRK